MSRPVLVTAGATRNPIDRMRYLSAYSSGWTGVTLAQALSQGHAVHLLGSPEAILRGPDLPSVETFSSTRDLMARMEAWVRAHPGGVVVHAAAVGDYETEPLDGKVESGRNEWVVRLRPTPKIADHLRDWGPGLVIVTFKAAPPGTGRDDLVAVARRQLERTRSDLVFANVLDHLDGDVALVEATTHRFFQRRDQAVSALAAHPVFHDPPGSTPSTETRP
ncbi:MAG: hypothetical protein JXB39_16840 [Deltaproteobacteria bacterium]|nr:hypothetical protein [Deltaproteobacteria bacterium]